MLMTPNHLIRLTYFPVNSNLLIGKGKSICQINWQFIQIMIGQPQENSKEKVRVRPQSANREAL